MKKRQEGYVLVYVLIVIVLLALIGSTVCAISVRNLKAQQSSLARAQAAYQAEGQVERALGTIAACTISGSLSLSKDTPPANARTAARNQAMTDFTGWLEAEGNWPNCITKEEISAVELTLTAQEGGQLVTASVRIPVTIDVSGEPSADEEGQTLFYPYSLTVGNISYLSYRVETVQ